MKDNEKKYKQVREMPLLILQFCSHFTSQQFEFCDEEALPSFFRAISRQFPDAFIYSLQISSFENGFGYFFDEKDYQKLGDDLIYTLANYSAIKHKKVI